MSPILQLLILVIALSGTEKVVADGGGLDIKNKIRSRNLK